MLKTTQLITRLITRCTHSRLIHKAQKRGAKWRRGKMVAVFCHTSICQGLHAHCQFYYRRHCGTSGHIMMLFHWPSVFMQQHLWQGAARFMRETVTRGWACET